MNSLPSSLNHSKYPATVSSPNASHHFLKRCESESLTNTVPANSKHQSDHLSQIETALFVLIWGEDVFLRGPQKRRGSNHSAFATTLSTSTESKTSASIALFTPRSWPTPSRIYIGRLTSTPTTLSSFSLHQAATLRHQILSDQSS